MRNRAKVILSLLISGLLAFSCATLSGGENSASSGAKTTTPVAAGASSQYTLDDLAVNEDVAKKEPLSGGFGGYTGEVIKVTPINGTAWSNYSRPIYYDLSQYSGQYTITVSMSVMTEKSGGGSSNGTIAWTIGNGKGFDQFGEQVANAPTGWTDLKFSQTIDLAASGDKMVFIDGLNDGIGLVDLTLYIRNFKVSVEKAGHFFALTFNDCPSDTTGVLLDKLKELGIKATFFVVGMKINAEDPVEDANLSDAQRIVKKTERQAMVKRMLAEGHEIANHSYTNNYLGGGKLNGFDGIDPGLSPDDIPYLDNYSDRNYPLGVDAIRKELQDTQDAIQKAIYGDDYLNKPALSKFFRTPYTSDETRAANLIKVTQDMKLPIIYGTASSDYIPGTSAAAIAANIYNQRTPWGISVNLDPQRSPNIAAALDILVPQMLKDNYIFVTLSEMVEKRGRDLTPGNVYYSLNPDFK